MSTRVKVAGASVIIGALVVLIVLDRSTNSRNGGNDDTLVDGGEESIFRRAV